MRPLTENGERVSLIDKKTGQQKVDNRKRKQWKCQIVESTDWNSQENAKKWRKDLADTINATNEQLGIAVHWEHCSFKGQGIDKEPTMRRNSSRQEKRNRLKELSKMYALYVPRTLKGNFRTRADSIISDKTKLSGGRKKYNEKLIEM